MTRQIAINSRSTGKYWQSTINGRPHVVTTMVSIEGNSVMNSLFYPAAEVAATYKQLNGLPAPAGHPVVNGSFSSATDPLAVNAHNIGGVVLNPRMSGNQVLNDLAFDIEVANRDERGVEILSRIATGERIGVSTGGQAAITNQAGESAGKPYRGVVSGLEFDHVAVLLDEAPAGENTFTVNCDESEKILLCNVADTVSELEEQLQVAALKKWGEGTWLVDVLIDPQRAVVDTAHDGGTRMLSVPFTHDPTGAIVFTAEGDIVERKVTYQPIGELEPDQVNDMDKAKLILALLANSANGFTLADKESLESMTEEQLVNAVCVPPTVEQACAVVLAGGQQIVNEDYDAEGYAEYVVNRDAFEAFRKVAADERQARIDEIVANSKSTADDLAGLDDAALARMAESLVPARDFSGAGSRVTNSDAGEPVVNYN